MNWSIRLFFIAWLFVVCSLPAKAVSFTIATGDEDSLYYAAGKAISDLSTFSSSPKIVLKSTEGTNENLALLRNAKVDLAIVQSDIIYSQKNRFLDASSGFQD